jgi:hypothetical protein
MCISLKLLTGGGKYNRHRVKKRHLSPQVVDGLNRSLQRVPDFRNYICVLSALPIGWWSRDHHVLDTFGVHVFSGPGEEYHRGGE